MKTAHSANFGPKQFGRFIRGRRLSLGLSRADLAQRLGLILGSHVSHVERGETRITPDALPNWARALEIDTAALIEALGDERGAQTLTVDRSASIGQPAQISLA